MSYTALARKWRPQTFEEIVGQEHVTSTLSNALAKGRVAHAYLFTGPRGCGKTTMARLLAKALNCDEGPTPSPCGTCPSCEAIASGTFLDVLEIDAASNTGVDNIRELRENAQYQPTAGKKRIFIIDEVHMLSKGAFNALLKTLEEPPPHVHFIFATTEPVRIPRTILSRCQRFDFRLFTLKEIRSRLEEIVGSESRDVKPEALELLASLAEGSMRDGLSLLDQALSSVDAALTQDDVMSLFGLVGHDVYLKLNDAILGHDARATLDLVDELASGGHDLVEFARGLVGNFRDLLLLRLDDDLAARVEKPEAIRARLVEQAAQFSAPDLLHLTERSAENYLQLERAPRPRWLLEAQLVEYAQLESQVLLSDVLARLEGLSGGSPTGGTTGGAGGGKKRPGSKGPKASAGSAAAQAKAGPPDLAPTDSEPATDEPVTDRPQPVDRPAAASVGPAIPAAGLDATTTAAFRRFAEMAKERSMGIGTCLVEAAPCVEGQRLLLKFRPEHDFHRSTVDQPKILSWLGEIARECFGSGLVVCPVTETPAGEEERVRQQVQQEVVPTAQQELNRRTQANPELGRLIEGLGGRIIEEG